MKFSLSWINDYLPKMKLEPRRTAELLTMHAFEVEGLQPTVYSLQSGEKIKDWVLDLDILPNRMGDAAGHFGIARELAAMLAIKSKVKS